MDDFSNVSDEWMCFPFFSTAIHVIELFCFMYLWHIGAMYMAHITHGCNIRYAFVVSWAQKATDDGIFAFAHLWKSHQARPHTQMAAEVTHFSAHRSQVLADASHRTDERCLRHTVCHIRNIYSELIYIPFPLHVLINITIYDLSYNTLSGK